MTNLPELPEDERAFLSELVKASRQKPHRVDWVDRDGTERSTVLSAADAARLNKLAHGLKISKPELMRQAGHVPVKK